MSIIISGHARVDVDDAQVATLGPGDVIGELSMVDGQPSSATVTFIEPSTIFHIARTGFVPVWDKNPDISKEMLLAVVQRLRQTNELLAHS
jgi:CRP-like cAMP-binding protein